MPTYIDFDNKWDNYIQRNVPLHQFGIHPLLNPAKSSESASTGQQPKDCEGLDQVALHRTKQIQKYNQ